MGACCMGRASFEAAAVRTLVRQAARLARAARPWQGVGLGASHPHRIPSGNNACAALVPLMLSRQD